MVNILRLPQVQARTGLSRTAIYNRMKLGTFPKSIALGNSRAKGWIEPEIDAVIEEDIRRSRDPVENRGGPMTPERLRPA